MHLLIKQKPLNFHFRKLVEIGKVTLVKNVNLLELSQSTILISITPGPSVLLPSSSQPSTSQTSSLQASSSSSSTSGPSSDSKGRTSMIIGIVSSVGGIALLIMVITVFIRKYRRRRARREKPRLKDDDDHHHHHPSSFLQLKPELDANQCRHEMELGQRGPVELDADNCRYEMPLGRRGTNRSIYGMRCR